MGFFDDLKNTLFQGRDKLAAEVSKFRNAAFLEAVVASAVIISAADGNISAEEKRKLLGYVQNAEELKAFQTSEVIEIFNKVAGAYDFDADIGRAEALKRVAKLKGKDDQARLVVRVSIVIANSDGVFEDSEKAAVRDVCLELGLPPSDFDL